MAPPQNILMLLLVASTAAMHDSSALERMMDVARALHSDAAVGYKSIAQLVRALIGSANELRATLAEFPVILSEDYTAWLFKHQGWLGQAMGWRRNVETDRFTPEEKETLRRLYTQYIEVTQSIIERDRDLVARQGSLRASKLAIEAWLRVGAPPFEADGTVLQTHPIAIEREPDNVHVAWDDGRYTASLDRWQDGSLEWFFIDRETKQTEGSDGARVSSLPDQFFESLQVFT